MLKRYNLPILLGEAVILVIFSILVFALGDKAHFGTASFIISYIFVFLAIGLGEGLLFLVDMKKKHDNSINEILLFVPANVIAYALYFLVCLIALFAKPVKTTFVWVTDMIILVIYVAYGFFMWFVVAKQSDNREHTRKKVRYIRALEEELNSSADYVEDAEVKQQLQDLARDVRFSDPMSDDSLTGIEDQLFSLSGEIRDHAESKQYEEIKEKADKMSKLLKERNRKCKLLK